MFSVLDQSKEVVYSAGVVVVVEFEDEVADGLAVLGEGEVDSWV